MHLSFFIAIDLFVLLPGSDGASRAVGTETTLAVWFSMQWAISMGQMRRWADVSY
jgi:hypothetical protein